MRDASGSIGRRALLLGFPALLALLVHLRAAGFGFLSDDALLVRDSPLVSGPLDPGRIFRSEFWAPEQKEGLYRPLTILSFAVLGPRAGLQHALNLLLHALVCVLVVRLALRFGLGQEAAFLAGLLFAVHPVHVEAVVPIFGRAELLGAALALSAVLVFDRRSYPSAALGAGLFALALLAKESALLALPLAALLQLVRPGAQAPRAWPRLVLLAAGALPVAALKLQALGRLGLDLTRVSPLSNPLVEAAPATARLTSLKVVWLYVQRLCFPLELASDYSHAQIPLAAGPGEPAVLLGAAALGVLALLAVGLRRRSGPAAAGLAFVLLSLALGSNLLGRFGTIAAERLLYLPSLGLVLAIAALAGPRLGGSAARAVAGVLLAALALRSAARVEVFRDELTFHGAQVRESPRSAVARANLGFALWRAGDHAASEAAYRAASEIAPRWAVAHNGLGVALRAQGRAAEALAAFEQAASLGPGLRQAWVNLAPARLQAGDRAGAVLAYRRWLELEPERVEALLNLGGLLAAGPRAEEAAALLERALARGEEGFEVWHNLALARARSGRDLERGLAAARRAAALRPEAPLTRQLLFELLAATGRSAEARIEGQAALALARDEVQAARIRARLAGLEP